jgi:hypothetical protein
MQLSVPHLRLFITFFKINCLKKYAERVELETPIPTLQVPVDATTIITNNSMPKPIEIISLVQEVGFIESFAGQYAVSPHILRHIATCESGFNPSAIQGKYVGLFQFAANTWKNYRLKIGEDPDPDLRFNAEEAVQTAAFALSRGNTGIWPNCAP